jgi:hypothetical protein
LLLSLRRWRCSNGNAGIFPASLSHWCGGDGGRPSQVPKP